MSNDEYAVLKKTNERLQAALAALNHIAFEPLGHAEASPRECLDTATTIARDALASLNLGPIGNCHRHTTNFLPCPICDK